MKNKLLYKRIYYVPGILTLAIAPILFINKANKYISESTGHCLEIIVGVKEEGNRDFLFPHRDNLTFKLTGQSKQDSSILILIENFARGLRLSNNDSIGIKVILGKNIKYRTFIDLLNKCLKSGINHWIPFGDTVFIYHKKCPNDYNNNLCQNSLMPLMEDHLIPLSDIDYHDQQQTPSLTQKIKKEFQKISNEKELITRVAPLVIVYFVLIYLTIIQIKASTRRIDGSGHKMTVQLRDIPPKNKI